MGQKIQKYGKKDLFVSQSHLDKNTLKVLEKRIPAAEQPGATLVHWGRTGSDCWMSRMSGRFVHEKYAIFLRVMARVTATLRGPFADRICAR